MLAALVAVAGCKKKQSSLPAQTAPPVAAAPAPTAQLTASPTVISAGDQVQLSWSTTNATNVSLEGIGDVPTSGVKTVTPTESTTYNLIAKGDGGTAMATARVTVNAPPVVSVPSSTMSAEEKIKIVLGGYCDERGSDEYNLALGQNRADATKNALVTAGVAADRIRVISYGKEKPFCAASTEACWQLNRRAGFSLDQ